MVGCTKGQGLVQGPFWNWVEGEGPFCVGLQTTDTPRKDVSCGCLISESFI